MRCPTMAGALPSILESTRYARARIPQRWNPRNLAEVVGIRYLPNTVVGGDNDAVDKIQSRRLNKFFKRINRCTLPVLRIVEREHSWKAVVIFRRYLAQDAGKS